MNRSSVSGDPVKVAKRLLGAHLVSEDVTVRLIDVEAYGGVDDEASHAYRGETPRTHSMFGRPGLLYVYLSYGIHHCANVVCGAEGSAAAVLLRGAEVLEGEQTVAARRGRPTPGGRIDGPGRLCQALGLDRASDGIDLLSPSAPVRLEAGRISRCDTVVAGPRVGITKAVDRPWRFRLVMAR